jgi:Tol biopolymer transport system component
MAAPEIKPVVEQTTPKLKKSKKTSIIVLTIILFAFIFLVTAIGAGYYLLTKDEKDNKKSEDSTNEETNDGEDTDADTDQQTPNMDDGNPLYSVIEYKNGKSNKYIFYYDIATEKSVKLTGLPTDQNALTTSKDGKFVLAATDDPYYRQLFLYEIQGTTLANQRVVSTNTAKTSYSGYMFSDMNTLYFATLTFVDKTGTYKMYKYDLKSFQPTEIYKETVDTVSMADQPRAGTNFIGVSSDGTKVYFSDPAGGGFFAGVEILNTTNKTIKKYPLNPIGTTAGVFNEEENTIYYMSDEVTSRIMAINLDNGKISELFKLSNFNISNAKWVIYFKPIFISNDELLFTIQKDNINNFENMRLFIYNIQTKTYRFIQNDTNFDNIALDSISNNGRYLGLVESCAGCDKSKKSQMIIVYDLQDNKVYKTYNLDITSDDKNPMDAISLVGWIDV